MPHTTHIQTEDRHYIRDMNSKALLCTDRNALERHRRQYALLQKNAFLIQRIEEMESQLQALVTMFAKMTEMLQHGQQHPHPDHS